MPSEEYNLSMDTFDNYVGAFNKLFVINDLEADLVLHLGDGRYALIECKLGS